jgi:hypothetical protein
MSFHRFQEGTRMSTTKTSRPKRGNDQSNRKSSAVSKRREPEPVRHRKLVSDFDLVDAIAQNRFTGTDQPQLAAHLADQLCSCLWFPADMREGEAIDQMTAAIAAVAGVGPRNALEGMLAVQAIATHNVAMELLRRAMFANQTPAGIDLFLKHSTKLLRIYKDQMETLIRVRQTKRRKTVSRKSQKPANQDQALGEIGPTQIPSEPGGNGHAVCEDNGRTANGGS